MDENPYKSPETSQKDVGSRQSGFPTLGRLLAIGFSLFGSLMGTVDLKFRIEENEWYEFNIGIFLLICGGVIAISPTIRR